MPGPRKIVPLIAPAAIAARAPSANLVYHGGKVLGAVQVIPLFWGSFWAAGDGAHLANQINGFFDFLLTSSFMDMLGEYSTATTAIGRGSRPTSLFLTGSEPGDATVTGRTISDEQIQSALQAWITTGTIPPPTDNTLYFVYLPPNVVSTMGGDSSCAQYCGYHNHVGGTIFYAVEPYITCLGCSFGTILDSLTKVSSHELAEAVTDPALDAWFDPNSGEEIGDICNTSTTHLGGFLVQNQWSNARNACVIDPAASRPPFAPAAAAGHVRQPVAQPKLESFRAPAQPSGTPGRAAAAVNVSAILSVVPHTFSFRENTNTPGRFLEQSAVVDVPAGAGFFTSIFSFTAGFTTPDFQRLTERPLGQLSIGVGLRGNNFVCTVRLTDSNSDDPIAIDVSALVVFFN